MKKSNIIAHSAIVGLVTLGVMTGAQTALAGKKDMEKCYGIVKAGKNDCQTATSACAGTSTKDGAADAFIMVPKGSCDKIVGGSTKSKG